MARNQERRIMPRRGPLGGLIQANVMGRGAHLAIRGARHLMETMKERKTSKGRTSTKKKGAAVKSLPSNRIGAHSGLIISNQKVPRPKKGSIMYRRSCYGRKEVPATSKAAWVGGSTIGTPEQHYRAIAHAILARYMLKMGDFRATNNEVGSTSTPVFQGYQLRYAKDAPSSNMFGLTEVNGLPLLNKSYEDMATEFGAQIHDRARKGLYPVVISFFNNDTTLASGEVVKGETVLRDTQIGRHSVTVSIKGRFRFQNVSLASGSSVSANSNINAVDANPLSGKIYSFRNQAPLFSDSYLTTFTKVPEDVAFRAGVEELQSVNTDFEMYGSVVGTGGKGGLAFQLEAPPLNPASIWSNCSKTGQVVFPPGGFKTFKTSYLRSGTIRKYLQDITQCDKYQSGDATGDMNQSKYPPAGDSFMMCLRPTIKTGEQPMELVYDSEHVITAMIKTRKPSPLQVVNTIE